MRRALSIVIHGLWSAVPEMLALAGVVLVGAAAWDVDPRLGKLIAGVALLYAARQLARTPEAPSHG